MGITYCPARSCQGKTVNLTLLAIGGGRPIPSVPTLKVTHVVTSDRHGWVILADETSRGTSVTLSIPAAMMLPVLS
jgi:hypothetical protein